MMTETQRAALMAAEDAFRRESDYYAMIGKETKARANMALAGQIAAALAEPETAACGPAMTRWYFVNQIGMATVCADKSDAEKEASVADKAWPRHAPHVVMQLVDAAQRESERTARQAAQRRIEELQAQLVLADAERCMAVSNAMRRMQAREKLTYTDKEVELIMLGWQAELQKAVAAEREACALIAADSDHVVDVPGWHSQLGDAVATARQIEAAIRARGSQ